MRDDDALDLSAWEAPPPPDGIADAVIARMDGTAVGPAMPEEPPSRKRWLVIATSAAAVLLVAAGAWALVHGREHAPSARGEVIADRAQHVELGGASADLDRGAEIRWQRSADHVHVDQKAGIAVWRVGEEHVEIAASVATIDARNASFKVEVPMNFSDARVFGASAVTAAAVAMVTVVVYEGHVKVHSGDQTVIVQPGSTFTVPRPAPEPPVVGVATGKPKVAVLGLEGWSGDAVPRELVDALRARANTGSFVLAPDSAKELADEKVLHHCTDEESSCLAAIGRDLGADILVYGSMESTRAGYPITITSFDVAHAHPMSSVTELLAPQQAHGDPLAFEAAHIFDMLVGDAGLPDAPDDAAVQAILAGNVVQLDACHATAPTLVVTINGAGRAIRVQTTGGSNAAAALPCISQVIGGLAFPRSKHGGTFTRPLTSSACDVDALIEEGNGQLSRDKPAAALAKYEQAIACKAQPRLYKLAFTAACKVPNAATARMHWSHLSAEDQRTLLPLCLAQGISRAALDGTVKACDADDLVTQSEGADTRHDYAQALALAEKALACDPSQVGRIAPIAVMEACKGNEGAKALQYLAKVKEPLHSKLAMVCAKQGVTSFKACDVDALRAKGEDLISRGQYAAATTALEEAAACKPEDDRVNKVGFLASCKAKNAAEARRFYNRLTPVQQQSYVSLCVREGITLDTLEAPGTVKIECTPAAHITIDGVDTGKTTPASLQLPAGKHKLTFVIGGDRFTYPVAVTPGETTTISKVLQ
jgi:tetratricopeptide (TPR) repeat protein